MDFSDCCFFPKLHVVLNFHKSHYFFALYWIIFSDKNNGDPAILRLFCFVFSCIYKTVLFNYIFLCNLGKKKFEQLVHLNVRFTLLRVRVVMRLKIVLALARRGRSIKHPPSAVVVNGSPGAPLRVSHSKYRTNYVIGIFVTRGNISIQSESRTLMKCKVNM